MANPSSRKAIIAALIGNGLIAISKFVAAFITNSSAMFAEGVHSLADTGNQILLLYGMKQARKPADERYPFGHGKEVYFWSFVVAILIFAIGAGVSIYEGVHRLMHPEAVTNPMINYIVLGLAMIFEGGAWWVAFKEFRRSKGQWSYLEAVQRGKDPSLFVVLFEDSAAMLGLMVAFIAIALGQWTGNLYFDGAASVIIGLILAATATWLAYETKGLLIGESANPHVVNGIRELAGQHAEIDHVNEVLTMHIGPDFILANLSVDFADNVPAGEVERVIAHLDKNIKQRFPRVKRIFIEAEARRSTTTTDGIDDQAEHRS